MREPGIALAMGATVHKKCRTLITVAILGVTMGLDCLQSDLAKRFRETAGPGVSSGFSNALTDPANAEAGLREAGAAIFEGLGGVFDTRTPSSLDD